MFGVNEENEIPIQSFTHKMLPREELIIDEQIKEKCHVEWTTITFRIS